MQWNAVWVFFSPKRLTVSNFITTHYQLIANTPEVLIDRLSSIENNYYSVEFPSRKEEIISPLDRISAGTTWTLSILPLPTEDKVFNKSLLLNHQEERGAYWIKKYEEAIKAFEWPLRIVFHSKVMQPYLNISSQREISNPSLRPRQHYRHQR